MTSSSLIPLGFYIIPILLNQEDVRTENRTIMFSTVLSVNPLLTSVSTTTSRPGDFGDRLWAWSLSHLETPCPRPEPVLHLLHLHAPGLITRSLPSPPLPIPSYDCFPNEHSGQKHRANLGAFKSRGAILIKKKRSASQTRPLHICTSMSSTSLKIVQQRRRSRTSLFTCSVCNRYGSALDTCGRLGLTLFVHDAGSRRPYYGLSKDSLMAGTVA